MQTSRPLIGVGVVVQRDGEVLLVKRRNVHGAGTWSTPGGALELGETIEACAAREALEETGVAILDPGFLAVTNDVFDARQHYVTIWMLATHAGGEPAPLASYEISEAGWFARSRLPAPLFLSFEHLVRGVSLPANAWRA